jgi:hypothetical protein
MNILMKVQHLKQITRFSYYQSSEEYLLPVARNLTGVLIHNSCRTAALPGILNNNLNIWINVFVTCPNGNFYADSAFHFKQNFSDSWSPAALIDEPPLIECKGGGCISCRNINRHPLDYSMSYQKMILLLVMQ